MCSLVMNLFSRDVIIIIIILNDSRLTGLTCSMVKYQLVSVVSLT